MTFSFSGFAPGKHIYGYYIRKKVVAKAKFAKAQGRAECSRRRPSCSRAAARARTTYKVTFESSSKFDKNAFPRVTGTLNILHF